MTGTAFGEPLMGHHSPVWCVAHSPDGKHIVSGSYDGIIRMWDANTGTLVGKPLIGHAQPVASIAYSPDGQRIVSRSYGNTIRVWDSHPYLYNQRPTSPNPMHAQFYSQPDADGWVKDPEGGLLYWIPPDCRSGLQCLVIIPPSSRHRSVSLDFEDFVFGRSWTQIFNGAKP